MKNIIYSSVIIVSFLITSGCAQNNVEIDVSEKNIRKKPETKIQPVEIIDDTPRIKTEDFSSYSQLYKFRGDIPSSFIVEYINSIESINIYDSEAEQETALNKSKIFIRYFRASDFLTLSAVDILEREKAEIGSHDAVRYEIEKKKGIADFPNQPIWRNKRHKLIDIRLDEKSPTLFYVFAYSPDFPEEKFEQFIASLVFQGD